MGNVKSLDGIPLTASQYYYDADYTEWENLKYFDAIKKRRDLAKKLYFKLYDKAKNQKISYDDEVRMFKVHKAWKDNEKLLDERGLII